MDIISIFCDYYYLSFVFVELLLLERDLQVERESVSKLLLIQVREFDLTDLIVVPALD